MFFQHAGHIPIASVIVHPEFRWTNPLPRSDLAILLLSEDVLGIAPMAINTQTRLPPDVSAASVGYGAHTPIDEQGNMTDTSTVVELAGLKLQANIVTAPCGPAERARNLICWSYRGKGKRTSTGSSCRGDSGGPLYATSTSGPLLVGVTSAGGPSCLAGTVAYDMEVFAYRDWIRKHVEIAPSALRRVSTATLWRADRGDRDRIRQLVCTTCTRCADPAQSKGQVTIPAGARSMRVSVNCTPDEAGGSSGELGLIVRPRIGVVLPARQMQSPGCATSGRSTALSCSLPVTPGESWVVELRAGQRQQCQIVATVSR